MINNSETDTTSTHSNSIKVYMKVNRNILEKIVKDSDGIS